MATKITEDCINCGACEPACPVTAIFAEEDVPEEEKPFIEVDALVRDAEPNPAHLALRW